MSVPLFPIKLNARELTGPGEWADYLRGQGRFSDFVPPGRFVFTWQGRLFKWIKSRYAHRVCRGFIGDVILLDGRLSHEPEPPGDFKPIMGVAGNFGIGAPAAVLLMESLIALGVKDFLGLGTAGGLLTGEEAAGGEPPIGIGDLLLARSAFRDEGTSYHYLPPEAEALASPGLSRDLEGLIHRSDIPLKTCPLWTTDALFRETGAEVEYYAGRGARAVDMEVAALYGCAAFRKARAVSLFVISDLLTPEGWKPDFLHARVYDKLKSVFEILWEDARRSGGKLRVNRPG